MNVAIIGYGKMGHEIEKILLQRGHTVGLIIDQNNAEDLCAERLGEYGMTPGDMLAAIPEVLKEHEEPRPPQAAFG